MPVTVRSITRDMRLTRTVPITASMTVYPRRPAAALAPLRGSAIDIDLLLVLRVVLGLRLAIGLDADDVGALGERRRGRVPHEGLVAGSGVVDRERGIG